MGTQFLPKLAKLNLSPEGRESVRIAKQYANTRKYETIIDPPHMIPGQPPAGPLRPENSGIPEPKTRPTPEEMERLRRNQAIIDHGIQDRIRQAEADQDKQPEPNAESDNLEQIEQYFPTATIPPGPIRINAWTTVHDPIKAIQHHMTGLKSSPPGSLAARADQYSLKEIKAALKA